LTINPFGVIKDTLPIAGILGFYGVDVIRGNKALCPLHKEKTPSFTIYPSNNSWHCFGCGAGGSVIDFIMAYFGLNAIDSARRLDSDFRLGLFDHKPSQEELHKSTEEKARRKVEKGLDKAFEGYMSKAYSLLCDYTHMLRDWKVIHAPRSIEETDKPANGLFVEACHKLDYIEYLINCLISADIDEQMQFYETHRKEMLKIATRVKLCTNSREAD
jgi:hypothetical protein